MATKVGELVPQIYNHPEFGDVRVVDNNGDPWFVGRDVAEKLGYANPNDALAKHVDSEDKLVSQIAIAGQRRNVTLINEGGLYSLTVRSNLPGAKKFTRWLTHDVAISIRKHGFYATPAKVEEIVRNPEVFIEHLITAYQRVKSERDELQLQVTELKSKADYCEAVLESDEHLTSELIAKEYGKPAQWLHEKLRDLNKMYKRGRNWHMYQPYAGEGYRDSETVTLARGKTVMNYYWTQKGRNFIYNTLKEQGILPIIERENPLTPLF